MQIFQLKVYGLKFIVKDFPNVIRQASHNTASECYRGPRWLINKENNEYPTEIGITEEYLLGGISPRTGQMERGKRDTRDGTPSSMTASERRGIIHGHFTKK